MTRTLIKNVWIYDGTGTPPFFSDVLLEDQKISAIQRKMKIVVGETVEGNDMALAPGFINVHSHSDLEIWV